jgi:hypothetical protein
MLPLINSIIVTFIRLCSTRFWSLLLRWTCWDNGWVVVKIFTVDYIKTSLTLFIASTIILFQVYLRLLLFFINN